MGDHKGRPYDRFGDVTGHFYRCGGPSVQLQRIGTGTVSDHLMLSEEEQLLRTAVRGFADDVLAPRASGYDRSGDFPSR